MTFGSRTRISRVNVGVLAAVGFCCVVAQAQTTPPVAAATPQSLRQIFEAAWARQPEAQALTARRDATQAQLSAAQAWTPEPAALELGYKTDRLARNQGAQELEVGVSVPLWLPGEQRRSAALAQAEAAAIESRATAAQLRVAATVREAWWQWQRSRIEAEIARGQVDISRQLATDVAKRTKAGELARADQHQADGAVAAAEASLAQAEADLAATRQQLQAFSGTTLRGDDTTGAVAEPDPSLVATDAEAHAQLLELKDKATVAQQTAALTAIQSRANPELTLAMTQDRGAFGERFQRSLSVGLRIPFGAGPRHNARTALAAAETTEAQAQLDLERERLAAERAAARARVEAARTQLAAAERRVILARESRGFFEKSFRLGETDLPTRLRIEAEAAEAERQAARSRIELAAAVSTWRQALGLLPQ